MTKTKLKALFTPLLPLLIAAVALLPMPADAALGDNISTLNCTNSGSGPYTPTGLTWDGDNFRIVNNSTNLNRLYTYDTSCSEVSYVNLYSTSPPNHSASGITWDGSYLYIVDTYAGQPASTLRYAFKYTKAGVFVSRHALAADQESPQGVTWDGQNFWVTDSADDKVYAYNAAWDYIGSKDFALATGNDSPNSIMWDGSYLRIGDHFDRKFYAHTRAGTYTSTQDFATASTSTSFFGATYAAGYIRALFTFTGLGPISIYAYEGATTSTGTHGLPDDADYFADFNSSVSERGDWKCISNSTGEDISVNNAEITFHGFCAKNNSNGMDVEIHLASNTIYADFERFAQQTGEWWFLETGISATGNLRIYSDDADADGAMAFTEETGGLALSNRLGFSTMAKSVNDVDCDEETDGSGFACNQTYLTDLTASEEGVLLFTLDEDNTLDFATEPATPDQIVVSRNADYTTATISWELYGAVAAYQVNRLAAVQVFVGDASKIEYGDPHTFTIEGTQAGIDEYEDTTVDALTTYQYRIRARGAESDSWTAWSSYIFSGSQPSANIRAPGNIRLTRDSTSVTFLWDAPAGSFENYTVQRQELISSGGSTFFGNITTLSPVGSTWIDGASNSFIDNLTRADQIYEYRVAAVKNDQVGNYSEWFRSAPAVTSLGAAPANFKRGSQRDEVYDNRWEYWYGWDEVAGADNYQLQVHTYDPTTGTRKISMDVVTDTTYFGTAYTSTEIQVRARKLDADLCGDLEDDYCTTEWSGWRRVPFTPVVPVVEIPTLEVTDDSADESITEFRDDLSAVFDVFLGEIGSPAEASLIIQFIPIFAAFIITGVGFTIAWRRGQPSLGAGLGCAATVMALFLGHRLFGTPLAFGMALQGVVLIGGFTGLVRQFGVWR